MASPMIKVFKPAKLHYIGAVIMLAGIIIIIAGAVRISRINHREDISSLSFDQIEEGMYVNGKISYVLTGSSKKTAFNDVRPLNCIEFDSDGTDPLKSTQGYICDLIGGKYTEILIDEYYSPELYDHLTSGKFMSDPIEYEFDAVIVHDEFYEKSFYTYVDRLENYFSPLYFRDKEITGLDKNDLLGIQIKVIDISRKKLLWIWGLPFIIAGTLLLLLGGKPFDFIKGEVKENFFGNN